MKILHVVPSYKPAYIYGGPIESVARLCEELVKAGHTVQVFTTTANGKQELDIPLGTTQLVDGVPVIYFKRITKDPTHISPQLWRQLSANAKQYDVVHIHSWWNVLTIVAAYICYRQKVKVVLSPRGMLSNYILKGRHSFAKKSFHLLYGKKLLRQTYLHATSAAEAQECHALIAGWKGFIVPNIIWLPVLPPAATHNACFTILFLSRIHPKKGIEFLLKAISLLRQPVCLKIAGTGDAAYLQQLQRLAKQLPTGQVVEWLGWKERMDKFRELQQADLFVLLSYNENFANVVVESLHTGTPVFISDKVGVADYVVQQGLGWVVPLNEHAIAKQLETIINNTAALQSIQQEAPSKIAQDFAPAALIQQYIASYDALLNNKLQ